MSNSIFLDLYLRQHTGPVFDKVRGLGRSAFNDVDARVEKTAKKLNQVGAKPVRPRVDKRELEQAGMAVTYTIKKMEDMSRPIRIRIDSSELRAAEQSADRLKNKVSSGGRYSGGGSAPGNNMWDVARGTMLGGMAVKGAERGLGFIENVAHQMFDTGADAEQQLIGLKTFVGKDKAQYWYDRVQAESALTPWTTQDELPGMVQLIGAGRTPDRALQDLRAFMNALSATGNAGAKFPLELGMGHLSQMAADGRVDAQFMKEFQRTLHIPMTGLLADLMFPKNPKKGFKQIAEWTESGELKKHVSYDTFIKALEKAAAEGGKFAHAMEDQSQTIRGKQSTMRDWWEIGLSKGLMAPGIHDKILGLQDKFIDIAKRMPGMITKLEPLIAGFLDKSSKLIDWMGNNTDALIDLGRNIKDFTKMWLLYQTGKIGFNTVKAFRGGIGGALAEGVAEGAGMSAAGLMGRGVLMAEYNAAWFTAATGIAASTVLGVLGGAAGVGMIAWGIWNERSKQITGRNNPQVMTGMSASSNPYSKGTLLQPNVDVLDAAMHGAAGKAGMVAQKKAADDKKAASVEGSMQEISDAIVKGGQKVINIILNKPLIEKQEFKVSSMAEATSVSLNEQEKMLLQMLEGAAASVY